MKKFKKLLSVFLAVAVICGLMMTVASAAVPYANYSASDRGTNRNCPWTSSLNMSDKKATASITVQTRASGEQPAVLVASLNGETYTRIGYTLKLSNSDSIDAGHLLTVTDSKNAETIDTLIGARCNFTVMGLSAGNELKVGELKIVFLDSSNKEPVGGSTQTL